MRLECQECGTQFTYEGTGIVIFTDHKDGTPANGFCSFSCEAAMCDRQRSD